MREERGHIKGDVVVYETFTLWGSIAGNVKVVEGGKFYLRGAVYGDLKVEPGGRVHIFGNVTGDLVVLEKTKGIHCRGERPVRELLFETMAGWLQSLHADGEIA